MFRKILVPVDGSKIATIAARTALELAEKFGAKITLLHVISRSVGSIAGMPEALPVVTEAMIKEWQETGDLVLKNTLEALGTTDVEVETELIWGSPAAYICDKANHEGYDIIVIGSHGYGGWREWLLGSVSNRIAHQAKCPVLIVKGQ
ncbi:MAG: universal stress protein [Ignavibacteriales bacterium]